MYDSQAFRSVGQLEAARALVKGTEIKLEELPSRAVQSLILKVQPMTRLYGVFHISRR